MSYYDGYVFQYVILHFTGPYFDLITVIVVVIVVVVMIVYHTVVRSRAGISSHSSRCHNH